MNRKIYLISLLCLSVLIGISSCSINCIDGEGELVSDKRPVDGANGISVDIDADVSVINGKSEVINIVAQQNILEKIKTEVDGGLLKITSKGCFGTHEPVKIVVTLPGLNRLDLAGSGRIYVPDTFVVDEIKLRISGSGKIDGKFIAASIESDVVGSGSIMLAGSANVQKIVIAGSGDILADKMPCNEATVKMAGSGNASVYAIKDLEVKVTGSGTVRYRGKPDLTSKVIGSGTVVDDNH